jgi:arylsulfatase A
VPFVVRWPGKVKAESVSKETICLTDIFATAASIAKLDFPDDAGEDSFDLVPAFTQKNERSIRPATIHHSFDGSFAIRQGPWRLAPQRGSHGFSSPQSVQPKAGEPLGELYNLETDLEEKQNVWLQEPERVAQLRALLEQIQREGRSRPKASKS